MGTMGRGTMSSSRARSIRHHEPVQRTTVLSIALALACGAGSLVALDRVVAWTDLGYAAARGVPGERVLSGPEFAVRVQTNELGFRERRLPGPKPPGVVRVVALDRKSVV